MMKSRFSILVMVLCLIGCGHNPDEPVYDTANNPDGFPETAVALLQGVEDGRLKDYQAISETFADLYTENTDLLDDKKWSAVVKRLGVKFRFKADSLSEQGMTFYAEAAGMYKLAASANPDNRRSAQQAELFGTWLTLERNVYVDLTPIKDTSVTDLKAILDAARHFALGNKSHHQFFEEYLVRPLRRRLDNASKLTVENFDKLPPADQLLARLLSFDTRPTDTKLVAFTDPAVELAGFRLTQLDPNVFFIEAYLVPLETIDFDMALTVRLNVQDTTMPKVSFAQANMNPATPPKEWVPGKLAAFSGFCQLFGPPSSVEVGLHNPESTPPHYLSAEGESGDFIKLDSTVMDLM